MSALKLLGSHSAEVNAHKLIDHLKSRMLSSATALPAGDSWGLNAPEVDVHLAFPSVNLRRDEVASHVEKLYNAVTLFHMANRVNIIPVVRASKRSTSSPPKPHPADSDVRDTSQCDTGEAALSGDHDDDDIGETTPLSRDVMTAAGPGFDPMYGYVAVGGTFDRLHAGHKLLLTACCMHTLHKLRIGITGEALLTGKRFASRLESFETRKQHVVEFVSKIRPAVDLELEVDEILEFSGGTDRIPDVQALVASPETLSAVPKINALRHQRGLPSLVAIPIHFIGGESPSVSSTKLRQMEEGRDGIL